MYIGTLRYNSLEKAELVKKDFSEMLSKVYYTSKTAGSPNYIPEDKEIDFTLEGVSFNSSKNKRYTYLYANNQDIMGFDSIAAQYHALTLKPQIPEEASITK